MSFSKTEKFSLFTYLIKTIVIILYLPFFKHCIFIVSETLDAHISLAILRMPGGTNYAKYFETEEGLPLVIQKKRKEEKQQKRKIPGKYFCKQ